MKQMREELPKEEMELKSFLINHQLARTSEFRLAKTILFYLPIKNEASTLYALSEALQAKKILAAPKIISNSIFPRQIVIGKIKKGKFGVPEPFGTRQIPLNKIDLVIVPGVVFDLHGGRIGYGKGYYDKFLKLIPKAKKIGLAYEFQLVNHFPKEPHDIFVDKIITESRIIDCRKNRS